MAEFFAKGQQSKFTKMSKQFAQEQVMLHIQNSHVPRAGDSMGRRKSGLFAPGLVEREQGRPREWLAGPFDGSRS